MFLLLYRRPAKKLQSCEDISAFALSDCLKPVMAIPY